MRKVLLIAYACDRDDVSETWCSYQWTSRLIRHFDATVLAYNRASRFGAARAQLNGARVFEWAEPAVFERISTFSSMLKPCYFDFYRKARRQIRELLKTESFDLIHQYEPFAPRYPSPAIGLGVPVIFGPVGGSLDTPPGFRDEVDHGMSWYTKLRGVDRFRLEHDPWLRKTYAGADLVIGIAPYIRELLASIPLRRFRLMHETGVETMPAEVERRRASVGELKLLYVGRIVRTKGVRDAVRAMAHVRDLAGVTLDVLGEGVDRPACEAEAAQLGLGDRVRFHGWQAREVVDRFYADSDVFVFPSFREASGQVVIEAMSHGLPLIAAAYGGPGFTVGDQCGITVAPESPSQFAEGIGQAIRSLAAEPERVAQMGRLARKRVETEFVWDRKVERMGEIYAEIIEQRRLANGSPANAGSPP